MKNNQKNKTTSDISNVLSLRESRYIKIPYTLVYGNCDTKTFNSRSIMVYSFFAINKNLVNEFKFYLNDLVRWCGLKPNHHEGEINDKIYEVMEYLKELGYIDFDEPVGKSKHSYYFSAEYKEKNLKDVFNKHSDNENGSRFAMVWIDEIDRIMEYKNDNNCPMISSILLVLAYLRLKIRRRSENYNGNNSIYAETYSGYYNTMAEEIGVTPQLFSDCLEILCRLNIIYQERLPALRYKNDNIRTNFVIVSNYEARNGESLVSRGKAYYVKEINITKNYLNEKFANLTKKNNKQVADNTEGKNDGDTSSELDKTIDDIYSDN